MVKHLLVYPAIVILALAASVGGCASYGPANAGAAAPPAAAPAAPEAAPAAAPDAPAATPGAAPAAAPDAPAAPAAAPAAVPAAPAAPPKPPPEDPKGWFGDWARDFGEPTSFGVQVWSNHGGPVWHAVSSFDAPPKDISKDVRALYDVFPSKFKTNLDGLSLYYKDVTVSLLIEESEKIKINRFADVKQTPDDVSDDNFVTHFQRLNRTVSVGSGNIPYLNLGAGISTGTMNVQEVLPNGVQRTRRISFDYANLFATLYWGVHVYKWLHLTLTATISLPVPFEQTRAEFATETRGVGYGITLYSSDYCAARERCNFSLLDMVGGGG